MAGMTRLELATSCVTGRHSNQLSYIPIEFYLLQISVVANAIEVPVMVGEEGLEPPTSCL